MDSGTFRSCAGPKAWPHLLASPHALVMLFAAAASIELFNHEMWLDELNPWVIARDARSLSELFYNMRFEPHPRLWYLCLFALTRITRNPAAMQVFHGAIGTASVALLAYCSPFRRRDVWLLAFGYYALFEFCGISRGYALGILFALAACALASALRPRIVVIATLLALLANTSVFGLILACALALAIAPVWRVRGLRAMAIGVVILIGGIGLSLLAIAPLPESTFGRDWHVQFSLTRLDYVGSLLGTAYFPLPDFTSQSPWNSSLLVAAGRHVPFVGHFAAAFFGAVVFVLALVHLRRTPGPAAALSIGSAAVLALVYVEYSAGYRHHGHLFVLLVLVLWLAATADRAGPKVPGWLTFVLATQFVAGIYFVALDVVRPFSTSKDLARFLGKSGPIPIVVAQPDFLSYAGPPLSGYLRHRIYYAAPGGVVRGSYLWYDEAHARGASEDEIVGEISHFAKDLATDVFVVTSHWDSRRLGVRVADFRPDTIEGDERTTTVYRFRKPE